jgi:hypothetical protein
MCKLKRIYALIGIAGNTDDDCIGFFLPALFGGRFCAKPEFIAKNSIKRVLPKMILVKLWKFHLLAKCANIEGDLVENRH